MYPVEAMNTYESIPNMTEVFPSPQIPLPKEPVAQAQLATGVDAVCVDKGFVPPVILSLIVAVTFESAVAFPNDFTVYVRAAAPSGPKSP